MDSLTKEKILNTIAFRRYEVRKAFKVPGSAQDDYQFAIRMLGHEIEMNGEQFTIEAFSE